jgi:hypothetical protein
MPIVVEHRVETGREHLFGLEVSGVRKLGNRLQRKEVVIQGGCQLDGCLPKTRIATVIIAYLCVNCGRIRSELIDLTLGNLRNRASDCENASTVRLTIGSVKF